MEKALEAGYFEWSRRTSSDELAEQLDVSRATCLEHLRKAESKLVKDALSDELEYNGIQTGISTMPT